MDFNFVTNEEIINDLENLIYQDIYATSNLVDGYYELYLPKNICIICDSTVSTTTTNLTVTSYGYIVNSTGKVTLSGDYILGFMGLTEEV